jgi:hypothetical protein
MLQWLNFYWLRLMDYDLIEHYNSTTFKISTQAVLIFTAVWLQIVKPQQISYHGTQVAGKSSVTVTHP